MEGGPQFTRFHFWLVKVVYVIVYLAVVVTLFVLVDRAGKPPIWVVLLYGFLMLILVPSTSDLFISYDRWIELTEPQRKISETNSLDIDSLDIPDAHQSPFGTRTRAGQKEGRPGNGE